MFLHVVAATIGALMRSSSLCLTQCTSILIFLFLIFLKPGAVSYPAKSHMFIMLRNKMCNVYFWGSRILKCAFFNLGFQGFNVQLVSPKIKHCTYMYIFWVFFGCSHLYRNVMIKSNGNLLSSPSVLSCCTPRCRSV